MSVNGMKFHLPQQNGGYEELYAFRGAKGKRGEQGEAGIQGEPGVQGEAGIVISETQPSTSPPVVWLKPLSEKPQSLGELIAEIVNNILADYDFGDGGTGGNSGYNGWTPLFALATDGERIVITVDWIDGGNDKPESGYLGATGIVTDIGQAVNVRGVQGLQGIRGEKGDTGAKGDKGDTGATGAKGDTGDTPVKGTDYFTAEDKSEFTESVISAIKPTNVGGIMYGVCSTNENVAEKIVELDKFVLEKNARISVLFTFTNAAVDATLNVNNTGAKPVYIAASKRMPPNMWQGTERVDFFYNGIYWMLQGAFPSTVIRANDAYTKADEAVSLIGDISSALDTINGEVI